jgi:indolepyruvate ferredoxin oxidoreductase, beta subunit
MSQDPLNLIVCGVGGQGNILIARLVGRTLASNGYFVNIGETFGAAQRGGSVFSSLRISKKREYGPIISKGQGHVIIGLEPLETLRMLSLFGNPETVALANDREVYSVDALGARDKYPDKIKLMRTIEISTRKAWTIPATQIALELGAPVVANIVMLGAVVGANVLPLNTHQIKEEIRNSVPLSKVDINLEAFSRGMAVTCEKTMNAESTL